MREATIAWRVLEALDRLGLPYERIPIDPEHADTATFCEQYGYPPDRSANTIIVTSRKNPKRYAACVGRASTRLDFNHTVRRLMGVSRLSFATEEEARELTGMAIGGVTVIGLPKDLPIYVDEGLIEFDYVILGAATVRRRSRSLRRCFFACRTCKSSRVSPCRGLSDPVDASIG